MVPTASALEEAEFKPTTSQPHSSESIQSEANPLTRKLDLSHIPTFVPRNVLAPEELVWSPTSGTRPRRPDEIYQQSTEAEQSVEARPPEPMQFGQEMPSNVSSAYNLKNQYLFHGSHDLSDTPARGHRHSDSLRRSPPPQFKRTQSPLNPSVVRSSRSKENSKPRSRRRNNLEETPFPDSIDRMMEMATLKHDPSSRYSPSAHFDTTAYPVKDLSRAVSPSQFKGPRYPSGQVRGVYGAEPFSAPPSISGYDNLPQTGQRMYGGAPSPFQNQLGPFQSAPEAAASFQTFAGQVPYAPNPEIWAPQPRRGALSSHIPQVIHPTPQRTTQARMAPSMMVQAQIPSAPMTQAPNSNETLIVPPPGSLDALEHWNLLHQRETEIRARLHHANRPMTDHERQYISLLAEARVNAVATQLPVRSAESKGKWLAELGRTQRGIWKTGPGDMGFPPVIVARKMDFEKAVEREIESVSREKKKNARFSSDLDRAYGA